MFPTVIPKQSGFLDFFPSICTVDMGAMKNVVILGSTGSIGTQAIDVIKHFPDRLTLIGVSAHTHAQKAFEQASNLNARWVTITGDAATDEVPGGVELLRGDEGVQAMVSDPSTDIVLVSVVGAAGLKGTWAALQAGKDIALANKETLVLGGGLVMDAAKKHDCAILPVDSEHSAIFQALQAGKKEEVRRIVLTASGGPFREWKKDRIESATVEQALRHPTWSMGRKITIDSASLMNKALEVIEARWLFDVDADRIQVVVHPQSIVHSMVEFNDGSVIAQLSPPDMRHPIQYALLYPDRLPGPNNVMKWEETLDLHFEPPDLDRFPALALGFEAARRGGTMGAVLNAANEIAVQRFVDGEIVFGDIPRMCEDIAERHSYISSPSLDELLESDSWARREAREWKTS